MNYYKAYHLYFFQFKFKNQLLKASGMIRSFTRWTVVSTATNDNCMITAHALAETPIAENSPVRRCHMDSGESHHFPNKKTILIR